MSIFTNPISAAADEADAYIAAVLAKLADREPLEVLGRLPRELETRVADLDEARLAQPEAPGKWSILEVIQHLVDSEMVWAYRLRMVLAEDRPTLTGYDQDRWAKRLGYDGIRVEDALAEIGVVRQSNLRLLRACSAEDLERVGVHSERGDESVAHMLRLYAGHDLVHLAQIDRIADQNRGGS